MTELYSCLGLVTLQINTGQTVITSHICQSNRTLWYEQEVTKQFDFQQFGNKVIALIFFKLSDGQEHLYGSDVLMTIFGG